MPPLSVELIQPIVLILISILALTLKGKAGYVMKRVLLGAATLVVVYYYGKMIFNPTSIEAVQTGVAATRAEVPLKFQSTFNVGLSKAVYDISRSESNFAKVMPKDMTEKRPVEYMTSGMGSVAKSGITALDQFLPISPDKPVTKAKLIAVLSVSPKKKDAQRARTLMDEMSSSSDDRERRIGSAVKAGLLGSPGDKTQVQAHAKTIETTFQPGWYKEYILLGLYRAGDKKAYEELANSIELRSITSFQRCLAAFVVGAIGFLVGLVWLVIQIGLVSRKDSMPPAEMPQIDLKLKDALVVLIAWQATQICLGQLIKLMPLEKMKDLTHNPVNLALFLLFSYLLNMGPALFYIHVLVFKPNGMKYLETLKVRFRTATAGPVRLFFYGPLFWTSCIPLVVATSFLAGQMGSKGSDNPVLAQIVAASKSPDMLAIALLFFTIAVLAPICEEIIFRGFLYGVLRKNAGTFVALIGSSIVFSAIHLDKGGMLMLFAIGFVLALCYERTRSLVPCMIAHGMWNGGTLMMSLLLFS